MVPFRADVNEQHLPSQTDSVSMSSTVPEVSTNEQTAPGKGSKKGVASRFKNLMFGQGGKKTKAKSERTKSKPEKAKSKPEKTQEKTQSNAASKIVRQPQRAETHAASRTTSSSSLVERRKTAIEAVLASSNYMSPSCSRQASKAVSAQSIHTPHDQTISTSLTAMCAVVVL